MARYKDYDYLQGRFIPVYFDKQIIPGTFEHTLHYLIDNEIDLSIFDLRYQNDKTGAPACAYTQTRQGEHNIHGAVCRHPTSLYNHSRLHLGDGSGDNQTISSSFISMRFHLPVLCDSTQTGGLNRKRDVCGRRM